MFVGPESAYKSLEMLRAMHEALLARSKLSELDKKLAESIKDVIDELLPKPYKEYKDISQAVGNYVELRDMLGIERKSWEDHEADVKGQMERISMFLRDKGDEFGVDSFNTAYGTAYRNVKTSYRIESWEEYSRWMLETNNMQCVEKRPAKLAVKEIYETSGELPPGLSEHVEVEFNVRRPTKKASA